MIAWLQRLIESWSIDAEHVSTAWIAQQEQRERQRGIDSVCWSWPVVKE